MLLKNISLTSTVLVLYNIIILFVCVCLSVLQRFQQNAGCINVKVLVRMLHKYKNLENKRRVLHKNTSLPRNGYVCIYAASIEQPFVVYAYLTGVINLKAHMIGHIVSSY